MAGGERALECGASGAPQSRRHERHWSSSSGRAAEAMSASRSGRNTCWCFVAEEMRRCARGDWAVPRVPRVHLASLRRHHTAPTAHPSCQHTTNTPLSCQMVPVAHRACWGARQRSEPLLSVPWICSRRACHVGRQRAHHCGERCEGLKPGASGTLGMPKSAERRTYVRTAQGAASGCHSRNCVTRCTCTPEDSPTLYTVRSYTGVCPVVC